MTGSEDRYGTADTADESQWPGAGGSNVPVSRAHARVTGVREDSTSTSDESGMSDCGSAEGTAEPSAVTKRDRIRAWVARRLARFHPPDTWGEDRPGLAKLFAYAYRGAGAPADGPLRDGAIWWYRLVAFPVTAWAYQKAWMLERPFRGSLVLIVQIAWLGLNIATLIHFL